MKSVAKKKRQGLRNKILTTLRQESRHIFLKGESADIEGFPGVCTTTLLGDSGLDFDSLERVDLLANSAVALGLPLAAMKTLHADEGVTIGDFVNQLEMAMSPPLATA